MAGSGAGAPGTGNPTFRQNPKKTWVSLVAQQEWVVEQVLDAGIVAGPGAIQPGECLIRVLAQRLDLCNLICSAVGIFLNEVLQCRIGRSVVATDLLCQSQGNVLIRPWPFLLRARQGSLRIAALDCNNRQQRVVAGSLGPQLDRVADRLLCRVEVVRGR
jgi:hypothetical protein